MPKLGKDRKNGVVLLKRNFVNRGGELFNKGQLMIIKSANMREGTLELRPIKGCISVNADDSELLYVGTKEELRLSETQ